MRWNTNALPRPPTFSQSQLQTWKTGRQSSNLYDFILPHPSLPIQHPSLTSPIRGSLFHPPSYPSLSAGKPLRGNPALHSFHPNAIHCKAKSSKKVSSMLRQATLLSTKSKTPHRGSPNSILDRPSIWRLTCTTKEKCDVLEWKVFRFRP